MANTRQQSVILVIALRVVLCNLNAFWSSNISGAAIQSIALSSRDEAETKDEDAWNKDMLILIQHE